MTKCAEEMIEKRLRFALLITAKCLCESNELAQLFLKIIRHSMRLRNYRKGFRMGRCLTSQLARAENGRVRGARQ